MTPFVFLCIGLLLLFLEFYTPGGILAVAGVICILLSGIAFITSSESLVASMLYIVFSLSITGAVIWFALYKIKKSAEKNTFYLGKDQEGYRAAAFDTHLLGKKGSTLTDLGPSGFVLIEGIRLQARSRGGYIDRGQSVEVVGGEGAHIIVKVISEEKQ